MAEATPTSPPGAPKPDLTVTESAEPLVTVRWNDVDSGGLETDYSVRYSINGGPKRDATLGSGNSATFTVKNLRPGESVHVEVEVTARNDGGSTVGTIDRTVSRPVPMPTELEVEPVYGDPITINIDWRGVSGVSKYGVAWSVNGGEVSSREVDTTSFVLGSADVQFQAGQSIKISVRAIGEGGARSDALEKTIIISPPEPEPDSTADPEGLDDD